MKPEHATWLDESGVYPRGYDHPVVDLEPRFRAVVEGRRKPTTPERAQLLADACNGVLRSYLLEMNLGHLVVPDPWWTVVVVVRDPWVEPLVFARSYRDGELSPVWVLEEAVAMLAAEQARCFRTM